MKVKKLMSKVSLALALGVMASGVSSIPAYAANTSDTPFYFSVGFSYDQAGETGSRFKENSTSVYMKSNNDLSLWVQTKGYNSGRWENYTKRGHAVIGRGEWFIHNYIHESGAPSAKLNITSEKYGTSGYADGVWSPDSVGSYPVANP